VTCPACGLDTIVTDSRVTPGYRRRRRKCQCGRKLSTVEISVPARGCAVLVQNRGDGIGCVVAELGSEMQERIAKARDLYALVLAALDGDK